MKIIEKIEQRIYTRYAFDFSEKLPNFDLNKTNHLYLPEHVNKFFDVINVQKGLSKLLLEVPVASIQILFGLILLAFYHPIFIAFGLILLTILILILKVTSRKGLETSLEESKYKYMTVSWLQEMARVIKSFKLSQGSHLNLIKTDKNVLGYLKSRTAHFNILLIQYQTLVFFKVLITLAMLLIGSYLLIDQKINIGEFIAAEIVIIMVIGAVEKLISSLNSIYDVITGLEKLDSVIESPQELDGNIELKVGKKGIAFEFENFHFDYDSNKKIFENLHLVIPADSIIAIQGQEGIGKTTLLRILSGNYRSFKGSLSINNIPIQNYQLESLRSTLGVYLQQQDIFKGTVLENISMGRKDISVETISDLSEKLGIGNFIKSLEKGFETEIDSSGKNSLVPL
ncbi:MAG: ATP-binding cassette domain-containing protein [Bacteroidetes bacterium]|nr:ATP-binding cassette domain-containing protein [Bacteroidota bacterium]